MDEAETSERESKRSIKDLPKLAALEERAAKLAESLEDREDGHLLQTITNSVGMAAASAGVAAAAVSGGPEILAAFAAAGFLGSILPIVRQLITRRRRKKYTSFSEIQDPVFRNLIEATAAEQQAWAVPATQVSLIT